MINKKDYFLTHSFDLIFSRISLALSGVLFWFVVARFYSIEDIGLGSALISVSSLLIFISSLGIAPTFIRFLPKDRDKSSLLGTLFCFSLFLLCLIYTIFILSLDIFLPKLIFLKSSFYPLLFLAFIISMQIFQILNSVYIAFETTSLVLLNSLIQNFLRIGLLFFVIALGGFGIFASNCVSSLVAIVITLLYFVRRHQFTRFTFDISILRQLLPFSLVNFLNSISFLLPGMLFPLMILSLFSAKEVGLFYIPWMIFFVYCGVIISINSVFLMKASYGEDVKVLMKKTIFASFCLGAIGCIVFIPWGDKILLIFKKDFSIYSFRLLQILFCSIFFVIINQIYITILNIRKDIFQIGAISTIVIISISIFSALFLPRFGIEGIAYAWLFANGIGTGYIVINLLLKKITRKAV